MLAVYYTLRSSGRSAVRGAEECLIQAAVVLIFPEFDGEPRICAAFFAGVLPAFARSCCPTCRMAGKLNVASIFAFLHAVDVLPHLRVDPRAPSSRKGARFEGSKSDCHCAAAFKVVF